MKSIPPRLQATTNYSIYTFAPVVCLSYAAMNLYTFGYMLNLWNSFDPVLLFFGFIHLIAPFYSLALSFYQFYPAQACIYYLSSLVLNGAMALLAGESVIVGIGLFSQAMTVDPTIETIATNLVNDMFIVMLPYAAMVTYLYFEVGRFQADNNPQNGRLYQGRPKEEGKLVLVIIEE